MVSLTLTDGGTASATRQFTMDVPALGHVYWANGDAGTIGRANVDGTGVDQSFITGARAPGGGGRRRPRLLGRRRHGHDRAGEPGRDGRGPGLHHRRLHPVGVAVDGGYVYWTSLNAGTIGRANLDGTGADQGFISGASIP